MCETIGGNNPHAVIGSDSGTPLLTSSLAFFRAFVKRILHGVSSDAKGFNHRKSEYTSVESVRA